MDRATAVQGPDQIGASQTERPADTVTFREHRKLQMGAEHAVPTLAEQPVGTARTSLAGLPARATVCGEPAPQAATVAPPMTGRDGALRPGGARAAIAGTDRGPAGGTDSGVRALQTTPGGTRDKSRAPVGQIALVGTEWFARGKGST